MRGWLRQRLKPLWEFRGSPHQLASAFALGIAIGILPATGAIAAAACAAVLRLNVPIAIAGALMNNPLTTPILYASAYALGQRLLGPWLPEAVGPRILLATAAGCLLLAIGLGLLGYLLAFGIVTVVRVRRARIDKVPPAP